MAHNFQLDARNYLRFKYREYWKNLTALAMRKLPDYYDISVDTLKALNQVVIENFYK